MTHPLLTGDQDPPAEWRDAIISGSFISFKRPAGDGESHYVVIKQGGKHGDGMESRPVTVWAVNMPDGRILHNWINSGDIIGEGVGMGEGAKIALKHMGDDADE